MWQGRKRAVASSLILASPLAGVKNTAGPVPSAAFWHTVCQSTARILAGFFLGLAAGLALACLSAAFAFVRVLLHPLVLTVKSVPVASFTVLALFWLRDAANLSMLISFLMVVPVVYANTLEALFKRRCQLCLKWQRCSAWAPCARRAISTRPQPRPAYGPPAAWALACAGKAAWQLR